MSESLAHSILVKTILNWLHRNISTNKLSIIYDLAADSIEKPPKINGYIPDIYAKDLISEKIFIGEAKTNQDIERERSKKQIESFYKFCSETNSTLIIAVPWIRKNYVQNLLRILSKKHGIISSQPVILIK